MAKAFLPVPIEDTAHENWAEKVCYPGIIEKKEKLYKLPGYKMYSLSMHAKQIILLFILITIITS